MSACWDQSSTLQWQLDQQTLHFHAATWLDSAPIHGVCTATSCCACCKFLVNTVDHAIVFDKNDEFKGFADASLESCKKTDKSTTGYVLSHAGGPMAVAICFSKQLSPAARVKLSTWLCRHHAKKSSLRLSCALMRWNFRPKFQFSF